MRCKEVRRIFRKWFLIKTRDFTERFSTKMGEATSHAIDGGCDRCMNYYNELVTKHAKEHPDGDVIYTYMKRDPNCIVGRIWK